MQLRYKKESLILLMGDAVVLLVSLFAALSIRSLSIPTTEEIWTHFQAFFFIWIAWILVYFIAGLYEKHTSLFKSKVPALIFNAQLVNSGLAILFFYLIPYFGLTPKTSLFIYLVISFGGMLLWRIKGIGLIYSPRRERGIIVGAGSEMMEVYSEVNNNHRYDFGFVGTVDAGVLSGREIEQELLRHVRENNVSVVVIDLRNETIMPLMKTLYQLIFDQVRVIDMHSMYEEIFDRVPLSLLTYEWFIENISAVSHRVYDTVKRIMDVVITLPLFIISIPFYILAWTLIKLDDGGSIFFHQRRIGAHNKPVDILKFRSMTEVGEKRVTRMGSFLRKSRIDELPQLWNVLKGDISLIGPRPEMPEHVEYYDREIPYYNVRHLLKPGLSGWAQIHQGIPPKFNIQVGETKEKLSYDFYYIKNRSVMLDVKIALQTIKTLLSRSGV
jgi:exopolysaccharide biosynthesis polyprenyl glycosylphosphotransferase